MGRRVAPPVVVSALLAFGVSAGPASAQTCAKRVCTAVVSTGDEVTFVVTARPPMRRYSLCVSGPYDRACGTFRLRRVGSFGYSRVVWNRAFPDFGRGKYVVRWHDYGSARVIGRRHFFRPRANPPCRFAGYRVVSRSREGVVLGSVDKKGRLNYATYQGCLFSVGSLVPVGGFDLFGDFYLSRFSWNGTQLAWFRYGQHEDSFGYVSQLDLRPPGASAWQATAYFGPPSDRRGPTGTTKTIRVRADGAIAWIGCPFGRERRVYEGNVEPYNCASAPTRPTYEVWAARTAGSGNPVRLDSGSDIAPGSLRLCGRRVCWTKGGAPRSGPFD